MIHLYSKQININSIKDCAPTALSRQHDFNDFSSQLKKAYRYTNKRDITIVLGYFYAKISKGRFLDIVGPHGLVQRNR